IAAVDVDPEVKPAGDRRWLLLRRSDFDIVDDWHTVGLKGTGSKTIQIHDAFIPDERVVIHKQLSEGKGEGARLYGSPLYCAAMDFTFSLPLAGPAYGIGRAAMQAFQERITTRLQS